MKSKATLFLMEQLVMLLVFALAAALCLGIFVRADRISAETKERDEAVILACNAAEMLKSVKDPQEVLKEIEKGIQNLTDDYVKEIDTMLAKKEKEILEV